MYLSYWEIIISMQTCKFLCIFYINPTHNIDKLDEGSKVESGIVMNVNTIELFQGLDGSIDTIDPCVRKLIFLVLTSSWNGNIGIPRCCCQQYLFGIPIDGHNDIDVRPRYG